jgi:hypothetical protein
MTSSGIEPACSIVPQPPMLLSDRYKIQFLQKKKLALQIKPQTQHSSECVKTLQPCKQLQIKFPVSKIICLVDA